MSTDPITEMVELIEDETETYGWSSTLLELAEYKGATVYRVAELEYAVDERLERGGWEPTDLPVLGYTYRLTDADGAETAEFEDDLTALVRHLSDLDDVAEDGAA